MCIAFAVDVHLRHFIRKREPKRATPATPVTVITRAAGVGAAYEAVTLP